MDGDKQRRLDNHHISQHGHWERRSELFCGG